jgi:hypothetical protein
MDIARICWTSGSVSVNQDGRERDATLMSMNAKAILAWRAYAKTKRTATSATVIQDTLETTANFLKTNVIQIHAVKMENASQFTAATSVAANQAGRENTANIV